MHKGVVIMSNILGKYLKRSKEIPFWESISTEFHNMASLKFSAFFVPFALHCAERAIEIVKFSNQYVSIFFLIWCTSMNLVTITVSSWIWLYVLINQQVKIQIQCNLTYLASLNQVIHSISLAACCRINFWMRLPYVTFP